MKKILNIFMVLMLIISISTLALADDADDTDDDLKFGDDDEGENETEEPDGNESEVDDDTEEEIEIMNNNSIGAEIRLLQLEKAILKNLEKGQRVVAVLNALDFNTTELESILEQMELLLKEVQNADPNATDAVQVFVDLKSDARNLTKEFKTTLKSLLSDVKYQEIKQQIRENYSDRLENLSKQLRNRIKQFNRNQIHRLYGIIGETNETVLCDYENGNMSLIQVKTQISKMVNHMIKQKRQNIFYELKGQKINNRKQAETIAENASCNFEDRELSRLQNRLDKAEEKGNTHLIDQIQNKIDKQNNKNNGSGNNSNNGNGKGNGK